MTLEEVYYGMMLPSGNDAAMNLAYYYGYLLGRKNRFAEY
jgi:D-alanyl-D-alanine carboxypeptidase